MNAITVLGILTCGLLLTGINVWPYFRNGLLLKWKNARFLHADSIASLNVPIGKMLKVNDGICEDRQLDLTIKHILMECLRGTTGEKLVLYVDFYDVELEEYQSWFLSLKDISFNSLNAVHLKGFLFDDISIEIFSVFFEK